MSLEQPQVIIVTGLSGAGISTTLDILEDQDFEAVDNLPVYLLETVLDARKRPLALSIDVRNRDFNSREVGRILLGLRERLGAVLSIIFMDCSDDELIKRFSKTKRTHPMARDARIMDGVMRERVLLQELQHIADYRLDTTGQSIWQYRERLLGLRLDQAETVMRVRVVSFSYGHGLPRDADLVIDVRFLRNPFYVAALSAADGRNAQVAQYVMEDERFPQFWRHLCDLLSVTLDGYAAEGKSYLTIAFGCTGGKHRSVALSEQTAKFLSALSYDCQTFHREIMQDNEF